MTYQRRMQPWLGTFVEVGIEKRTHAGEAIDAAFDAIAGVHRLLSFQDPDSDLSRLNGSRGEAVDLHPLSVSALRLAKGFMRASGERFNCTVAGELERTGTLPAPGCIAALAQGRSTDIEILGRCRARLRRPVHVTLDGIAKGLAVDRLALDRGPVLNEHVVDTAGFDIGNELRIRDGTTRAMMHAEVVEHQHQHERNDHPQQ